jgi:threonine dehydrogenase-like Zn-dependent dehydrogenase
MKAVLLKNNNIYVSEIEKPEAAAGEALIKVRMAAICNTDIELTHGYMSFQGIPGHEFIGIVEQASDESKIGKRVVGEINCVCNKCKWCKSGMKKHCMNRTVLGIYKRNGAMAEYMTLPEENLHLVDDSISDEWAIFTEPLAAAFDILEQVHIDPANRVLLLGDGKLAQLIAQVICQLSVRITVVGKHEEKLSLLRNPGLETYLLDDFEIMQYPVVIDATGSKDGFNMALQCTEPGGTMILKSTVADQISIDISPVVINEIKIVGSRCGPFQPALRALRDKKVTVDNLISKIYPLSQAKEAFEYAKQKGVLKVLLDMRK